MFTIRQLQMFEAVARLASYSEAGEELEVSQPSVSVQIQELEKALGLDLFDQSGRRTKLTEAGAVFYGKSAAILQAVEDARASIDGFLGLQRGRVRVGAVDVVGLYVLPRVLARFGEAHPGVELELTLEAHNDLLRGLELGRLDIAYTDQPVEDQPGLQVEPLAEAHFVAVVPRDHPLALQRRTDAIDLRSARFVVD